MRATLAAVLLLAPLGCTDDTGDGTTQQPTTQVEDVSTFWLPINSERLGASGYLSTAGVCVGLVWDFSNLGMAHTQHCDDFVEGFPYAVLRAPVGGSCDAVWDYGPDAAVTLASGCIDPDWESIGPHSVDVTAHVTSATFTGFVHLVAP